MNGKQIQWMGLEVALPHGWDVRLSDRTLTAYPVEARSDLEDHTPFDGVAITALGQGAVVPILRQFMASRVRQGEYDLVETIFANVTAFACEWSDGVASVLSWFFAVDGCVYEVELVEPYFRERPGTTRAIEAKRICDEGISITAPRAD